MITVIICSVNPELREAVTANIAATIGVEFELIAIDNQITPKGICTVYNEAAAKAGYPYLCFVHEDVCFHTQRWGQVLVDLLSAESHALVGVSGAVYKSDIPGSWVDCDQQHYRVNALQHFAGKGVVEQRFNPERKQLSEVAVIDGVFMATRKNIWENIQFDTSLLKGFHVYDLDFSLSAGRFGKVLVTHEILLEHFSAGSFSKEWINDTLTVHQKWKQTLPRFKGVSGTRDQFSDYLSAAAFLLHLLKQPGRRSEVLKYYCKLILLYRAYNGLRYSKSVFVYLFFNQLHTHQN
jgi:hypothetical protein